jgi:hypothetical protein
MIGRVSKIRSLLLLTGFLAGGIAISTAGDDSTLVAKTATAASTSLPPKAALRARKNIAATPRKREWGIEVLGVHQASAGYMLQFRYRVLDPKTAKPLFDRKIKPYLIDSATGAKVIVPSPDKVGQLRNTSVPEVGRTYWMMFANPAKMIKPGSEVSVHIGDFDTGPLVVN